LPGRGAAITIGQAIEQWLEVVELRRADVR
jgi:hypothetical protein